MTKNLISVEALADIGHRILFPSRNCWVINNKNMVIASGHRDPVNGLYKFQQTTALSSKHKVAAEPLSHNLTTLWYRRLGHLSYSSLYHLSRLSNAIGLPRIPFERHVCSYCMAGRQHRERFPQKSETRSSLPGQRIHSDIMGPMPQASLGGSKYILVFTDDYSRKGWVYFLKNKSETITKFCEFKTKIEGETGNRIQALQTD